MIEIEFSPEEIDALEYERYHYPHPQVQRKMEVLYLKSQGVAHQDIRRIGRIRDHPDHLSAAVPRRRLGAA